MTRAIQAPSVTKLSDLLWTAETLYNDLLTAGLFIAAASQAEVVADLRRRVREERETT